MQMHMRHRSRILRRVARPQQRAADGDGSTGEDAERVTDGSTGEGAERVTDGSTGEGAECAEQCAASSLRALHELWNVQHEHEAEVQLASFAACSWFGPMTRLRAAQCQNTLGRLRLARGKAWPKVSRPQEP